MTYNITISAEQLKVAKAARADILVFACEYDLADAEIGRQLYEKAHIPGARYIDLSTEMSAPAGSKGRHPLPSREAFAATMRAHGLKNGQQVVAYDSSGSSWAPRLWWLLRWIGHVDVAVLDGGLEAWRAIDGVLDRGSHASTSPGDIEVRDGVVHIAELEDVMSHLGDAGRLLLDARATPRFRGQSNDFDPVPGHIPGARNRPFKDNLTDAGYFKPRQELADDFARLLGGTEASQVVLYCGSGITACNNALAMEIAGLRGSRLFPGSWSEWGMDASRPIETGE